MTHFDVVRPLPVSTDEGSLISSEAAHCVRSTLDQLGYAIAVRRHFEALLLLLERRQRAYTVAA